MEVKMDRLTKAFKKKNRGITLTDCKTYHKSIAVKRV